MHPRSTSRTNNPSLFNRQLQDKTRQVVTRQTTRLKLSLQSPPMRTDWLFAFKSSPEPNKVKTTDARRNRHMPLFPLRCLRDHLPPRDHSRSACCSGGEWLWAVPPTPRRGRPPQPELLPGRHRRLQRWWPGLELRRQDCLM